MRRVLALLLLIVPPAWALSPDEAAYIAERDRVNAALEANWDQAAHDRAVETLTQKLRRIVGQPLKGFDGNSEMNTTLCCGVGAYKLDGMAFGEVVVTTEGLLRHWLAAQDPPRDLETGLKEGAGLYSAGLVGDAAVDVYAALPIVRPPGATRAVAHLALASQAGSFWPPQEIGVVVQKGDRILLTYRKVAQQPALPACEAALAKAMAGARTAWQAGRRDDSTRLEAEAETAHVECWNAHAREAAAWPAILQQAQRLADAFAAD
jgi:hypothetical protein